MVVEGLKYIMGHPLLPGLYALVPAAPPPHHPAAGGAVHTVEAMCLIRADVAALRIGG